MTEDRLPPRKYWCILDPFLPLSPLLHAYAPYLPFLVLPPSSIIGVFCVVWVAVIIFKSTLFLWIIKVIKRPQRANLHTHHCQRTPTLPSDATTSQNISTRMDHLVPLPIHYKLANTATTPVTCDWANVPHHEAVHTHVWAALAMRPDLAPSDPNGSKSVDGYTIPGCTFPVDADAIPPSSKQQDIGE